MKFMLYFFISLSLIMLSSCQPQVLDAVSTSFAKEYCSCLYVEKQDGLYCQKYAKQMLPVTSFSENKGEMEITVDALGKSATAKFMSKKLGCSITKYPEA